MEIASRTYAREEFVKGKWVELPPPSQAHLRLIQILSEILFGQLDRQRFAVITSDFGLGIEPGYQACRNPDLVVFSRDALRNSRTEHNNLFAKPVLIAECLSPRDRKGSLPELLDDYRRMRAPEVWIIDPHARIIESHWFDSDRPRTAIVTAEDVSPMGLPEVKVELAELWDAFAGKW